MGEFKIGQYVYYVPRRAEGRYVVMRLLPQAKGDLRYIIRSQADPEREYMAKAGELRSVPGARRSRQAAGCYSFQLSRFRSCLILSIKDHPTGHRLEDKHTLQHSLDACNGNTRAHLG
jgi:hypothetical protein